MIHYPAFFARAFGDGRIPYLYQERLAGGDAGKHCTSQLIDIPTGLGKTAAVVLAWLWNRVTLQRSDWPRRLVYCLPMRTLVEQTESEVKGWIGNLLKDTTGLSQNAIADLTWLRDHSPVILMGGEELDRARKDWDLYPEKPAILIGTQDMLLSRALNRGYAMSRYRWPMHFALLNNDCLWVMDETQLMGVGLSTAAQLEAFRSCQPQGLGVFPNGSFTWYASATPNSGHLLTKEWQGKERSDGFIISLRKEEKEAISGAIAERRLAVKKLELQPGWNFGYKQAAPTPKLIEGIIKRHEGMVHSLKEKDAPAKVPRRTLVICNTVDRAVKAYKAIRSQLGERRGLDVFLMHSRFRPKERETWKERLGPVDLNKFPDGQIVIATQVIEAGVDLSSGILWSEVAPLASLIQRLGRLNRAGEFGFGSTPKYGFEPQAIMVGIDLPAVPKKEKKDDREKREKEVRKRHLPYDADAAEAAWQALRGLKGDASPGALERIRDEVAKSVKRPTYSLLRHELLDFFDTDANLSLGFTDVSPFVRGLDEDTDVQVLWRSWPRMENGEVPDHFADFQRNEICSVSIGKANDAKAILYKGWMWRGKELGWASTRDVGIIPGATVLLPLSAGGYDEDTGWTGDPKDKDFPEVYEPSMLPSDEELLSALDNGWRTIPEHTREVGDELNAILDGLGDSVLSKDECAALRESVPWHDVGKNHERWQEAAQEALRKAGLQMPGNGPIAKFSLSDSDQLQGLSGTQLKRQVNMLRRSFAPGIAHEVASALAFRQHELNSFTSSTTLGSSSRSTLRTRP